ncbi:MAG: hypothetical protein JO292_09490 [Betaproteobacteria bacterium]|nr:hypothetical protein [Betaproteobacteria bacterium]
MKNEQRGITVYFNDGTSMKIDFPKQAANDIAAGMRLKEIFAAKQLLAEIDGALVVIPFDSIKYVVAHPAPPTLPEYTIKGASIAPGR